MHIVITGGAGFIGHHAVWQALERGWQVSVLDNFTRIKNIILLINNERGCSSVG